MRSFLDEALVLQRSGSTATHQIGFDKVVQIAVHDPLYIRGLIARPVVFDPAVVKNITADLGPPFDFFLLSFQLILKLHAFVQLHLVQFRTQNTHGVLFVHQLRPGFGIFHDDAGR